MQNRVYYYCFFFILFLSGFSLKSSAQTKASDTLVVVTDTTDIDAKRVNSVTMTIMLRHEEFASKSWKRNRITMKYVLF